MGNTASADDWADAATETEVERGRRPMLGHQHSRLWDLPRLYDEEEPATENLAAMLEMTTVQRAVPSLDEMLPTERYPGAYDSADLPASESFEELSAADFVVEKTLVMESRPVPVAPAARLRP